MRAGYFVRGEAPPQELDPRFDVVVLPWRTFGEPEWQATAATYQEAGMKVYVHIPTVYLNPDLSTPQHDVIREILDDGNGWLLGYAPEGMDAPRVGEGVWQLIDQSMPQLRRKLIKAHIEMIRPDPHGFKADGLMLDFLHDTVTWRHEFVGMSREDKEAVDATWRHGLYQFASGLQFHLGREGLDMTVYGNGWHRATVLDGTVYENFPRTKKEDGRRDMDVALNGLYGAVTWRLFREPPMILPADGRLIAYDLPKFRVVEKLEAWV